MVFSKKKACCKFYFRYTLLKSGDVPSYMKDVEKDSEPKPEGEGEEGHQMFGIGSVKKAKDGSEWLITHWCDVCKVGLTSERQLDIHNAGKPHEKKVGASPILDR